MQKLKAFQIIFSFAAILFIAKPFIGFGAFNRENKPRVSHTVLVKSFTKRKPENLHDAYASAAHIRNRIISPPLILLASFIFFLAATVILLTGKSQKLTTSVIAAIRWSLSPPQPEYLLSGKLII